MSAIKGSKSPGGKGGDKASRGGAGAKSGKRTSLSKHQRDHLAETLMEKSLDAFLAKLLDDMIQHEHEALRALSDGDDESVASERTRVGIHRAKTVPELVLPPGLKLKSLTLPLKLGTVHDDHDAEHSQSAATDDSTFVTASAGPTKTAATDEHHHLSHHFHHLRHEQDGGAGRESVAKLLLGLPGNLSMPSATADAYFGPGARERFFEQYQWVNAHRKIASSDELLVFASGSVTHGLSAADLPFAPVRPEERAAKAAAAERALGKTDGSASAVAASTLSLSPLSTAQSKGDATILSRQLVTPATPWGVGTRSDPGGLKGMHSASAPVLKKLLQTGSPEAKGQSPGPGLDDDGDSHHVASAIPGPSLLFSDPSLTSEYKYSVLLQQHNAGMELDKRGRPKVLSIPVTVHGADYVQPGHAKEKDKDKHKHFTGKNRRGKGRKSPQRGSSPLARTVSAPVMAGVATGSPLQLRPLPTSPVKGRSSGGLASTSASDSIDALYLQRRAARYPEEEPDAELEAELAAIELHSKLLRDDAPLTLPGPPSPRTAYLVACAREGVNPRASMVLRKGFTKILDLHHQAIGDKMGLILAESIAHMPFLQSLNLHDNRLTDVSLGPILKAIVGIEGLLELNISNNKMDQVASKTLAKYLGSSTCPLEKLDMCSADVDDLEGAVFISVLCRNPHSKLRELDMSHNLLGSAEQLNSVMDITTSGQAFAEYFKSPACTLEKLVVSWNMIRMGSGIDMASAVGKNKSLTELDISCNAFGEKGGLALASSLMTNNNLRVLNVANNSLESTACFALCAALCENKTLHKVTFDDNPVGVLGAKALMQVPTVVGSRIELSARGCNTTIRQGNPLNFDFDNILRSYELSLSKPFERAAAVFLLNLVACHHTLIFSHIELDPGSGKFDSIELVPFLSADKEQFFDESQKEVKDTLEGLLQACSDRQMAQEFFNEVDEDGSGELEPDEFRVLLESIGIDIDDERLIEVFEYYDTDQGGTLGLSEFYVFLKKQHADALKRLEDHLHSPAFARKSGALRRLEGGKIDPKTPKFLPPTTGRLRLTVEDGFTRKPIYRTLSACDKAHIEAVAEHCTDPSSMTSHGVQNAKLRVEEAYVLFQQMEEETRNKSKILTRLLPQLSQPEDARLLVAKAIKSDRMEMLKLRQALGAALRPLLGLCNGYYVLDLSEVLDRMCLMRLLEVSSTRAEQLRADCKVPIARFSSDFSMRKNDNSCFRNEMFTPIGGEAQSVLVDNKFASPMPSSGVLSFDFSGGHKPDPDEMVTSDARVIKTLLALYLLSEEQSADSLSFLARQKRHSAKCLDGNGLTLYECEWDRALKISEAKRIFYDQKAEREEQMRVAVEENEEISFAYDTKAAVEAAKEMSDAALVAQVAGPVNFKADPAKNKGSIYRRGAPPLSSPVAAVPAGGSGVDGGGSLLTGLDSAASIASLGSAGAAAPAASASATATDGTTGRDSPAGAEADDLDVDAAEAAAEAAAAAALHASKKKAADDEYQRRFRLLLASPGVSNAAKAVRIADALDTAFNKQWLLCRHLALIVLVFRKLGTQRRTPLFGSHRVDVVSQLFERVVDKHNFDLVLRQLTASEVGCVIARVGWLNIFCPLKPEGCIELNLSVYEERLIAKMLNTLATIEPGDNWPRKYFKWKHTDEAIPGWELKQTWMEDLPNGAGLPERGFMSLEYYSGEGRKLRGCRPHVRLRKALMHLVNIREEDVKPEEEHDDDDGGGGGGGEGRPGQARGYETRAHMVYVPGGPVAANSGTGTGAGNKTGAGGKADTMSVGCTYIKQNEVAWRKYLLA